MTWQEELRKLDEDFSSGSITADEYRARRDQVLSAAVTPNPPPQQASPDAEDTQVVHPVTPQGAGDAHPGEQPGPNPDATQVASDGGDAGAAERTQAVQPNWQQGPHSGGFAAQQGPHSGGFPAQQGAGWYEAGNNPSSGGFPAQAPPPGYPAPPGPQDWGAPAEADQHPLWGGDEFPPVAPPTEDWVTQGPEEDSEKGKAGKILVTVVAVVLVAGAAFGAWWFWLRGDDRAQAGPAGAGTTSEQQPATPTETTPPLPEPAAAKARAEDNAANLVDPPGTERAGGGEFDLKEAGRNKLLPQAVIDELKDAELKEGLLRTTTVDSLTIGLYSLEVQSEADAKAVAQEYASVQESGGVPANREMSMLGVPAFSNSSNSKEAVFRAVYVVHDRVVIVETFGSDRSAVQSQFERILDEQVEHAPPTDRT